MDKVYIVIDVETTGDRIGVDSMLSLGACVVPRVKRTFAEQKMLGEIFYVEMKPTSLYYVPAAVAVGASKLVALGPVWDKPMFIPGHTACNVPEMLRYLQDSEVTVFPATAMRKFAAWVQKVGHLKHVVGVTNTTFFDSGWNNYYCTTHGDFAPLFGWLGIDLRSFWGGATGNPDAKLKTAHDEGDRPFKHRADHDACAHAETARVVLFEKLVR